MNKHRFTGPAHRPPRGAESFSDFITGPVGGRILQRYGFGLPESENP